VRGLRGLCGVLVSREAAKFGGQWAVVWGTGACFGFIADVAGC
jgi:hypothetical protein